MAKTPRSLFSLGPIAVLAVLALGAALSGLALGSGGTTAARSPAEADASTTPRDVYPPPPSTGTDGLDAGLVDAFRDAQRAAAEAGHALTITSGYRSAARQRELLEEAIVEHGSVAEATRWVFPPERSMHVQGLAIDVGDGPAAEWLAEDGSRFGICHTLAWEWWHFEWRARWERDGTCPQAVHDPADAPGP